MDSGDRRGSAQGRVNLWASQAAKSAHGAATSLALDLTLPQGVGNMQYLTFLTCFRPFEAPHRRQGLVCDDKTYSGFIQPQVRFRPMRAQPSAVLGASFRRRSTGGSWVYPVDVFLGGLGVVVVAPGQCLPIGSVSVTIHLLQAHGPWDAERHMESRHSIYWSVSSCFKKHSAPIFIFYLDLFR